MPRKSRHIRTILRAVLVVCFVIGFALLATFLYGRTMEPPSATLDPMLFIIFVFIVAFASGLRLVLGRLFQILDRHIEKRRKPRKRNAERKLPQTSPNDPLRLFTKAQHELQRKNYEGAAEAFSFAAWAYADSEKWNEAGETFQRAAEAYSKDKLLQFGSACHYIFAAACFIIKQNHEKAQKVMQTANHMITEGKQDQAEREVSELLTFLELILHDKTQEAKTKWKELEKKIPRLMYPFPDQASNLLEKCLESPKTQQKPEELEQPEH